jgi:hypothetical protein
MGGSVKPTNFWGNKKPNCYLYIKVKALELREELLTDLEEKLGFTQANSKRKHTRWEREMNQARVYASKFQTKAHPVGER